MPSTQKTNPCAELKQTFEQLLSEKQEFDTLMAEINSLRPNFSKNLPEIKNNISKLQNSRAKIEEKITRLIFTFGNNSDQAQALVKKYASKLLSKIEKKTASQQDLSSFELTILYDTKDRCITLLSEEQKQKVKEIRDKRNASLVLGLKPEEIACSETEVNQNTKVYIGKLYTGIFTKLGHLEHIYTSFPEGKIRKYDLEIGGMDKEKLKQKLEEKNIIIHKWASDVFNSKEFTTSPETKDIELVQLTVENLGFLDEATTDEICQRAQELGLDLCPAEVGPHFRLQYSGKEWILVAMKYIRDSDNNAHVFYLRSDDEQLGLDAYYVKQDCKWCSLGRWVFSLRKSDS